MAPVRTRAFRSPASEGYQPSLCSRIRWRDRHRRQQAALRDFDRPMSAVGHSRQIRSAPKIVRCPLHRETGLKVSAPQSVAMGQNRTLSASATVLYARKVRGSMPDQRMDRARPVSSRDFGLSLPAPYAISLRTPQILTSFVYSIIWTQTPFVR